MYAKGLSNFTSLSRTDEPNTWEIQQAQGKLNKMYIDFITLSLHCLDSILLSAIHPLIVTTYTACSSEQVFELARKACFVHLYICSKSVTSLVTSLSRHIIKSMHSGIWGLLDGKVKEEKNRRPGRKKTWCLKGFRGMFCQNEGLKN